MSLIRKLLPHLPLPVMGIALALGVWWFLARWEGMTTATLEHLDQEQAQLTEKALEQARAIRAQTQHSAMVDRELKAHRARARQLTHQVELAADSIQGLQRQADSLLATLDSQVAVPVRALIRQQRAQILTLATLVSEQEVSLDSLEADRDRWRTLAGNEAKLRTKWQENALGYREEARRGCLPIIGCVSHTVSFAIGAGAALVLREAITH